MYFPSTLPLAAKNGADESTSQNCTPLYGLPADVGEAELAEALSFPKGSTGQVPGNLAPGSASRASCTRSPRPAKPSVLHPRSGACEDPASSGP
jgi:hypothetical protein